MTATRVIDDHGELGSIGTHTHDQIDSHIDNTKFLLVSGTGQIPGSARNLVAGTGISFSDSGPGGDFVISSTVTGSTSTGSCFVPTQVGQVLFSVTTGSFSAATPIVSLTSGWLMNASGILLVSASLATGSCSGGSGGGGGSTISRTRYTSGVKTNVPAGTNVTFPTNLDNALGDYSSKNFKQQVEIFLNGILLNPGANVSEGNDVYPGTSQTSGDLKFAFNIKSGSNISMTIY